MPAANVRESRTAPGNASTGLVTQITPGIFGPRVEKKIDKWAAGHGSSDLATDFRLYPNITDSASRLTGGRHGLTHPAGFE